MKKISEEEINYIISQNKFINSENAITRASLEFEKKFLEDIRRGNYRKINFRNFESLEHNLGNTTKDRMKKFEYITVTGLALASRTALDSGMNADDVFDISDAMLTRLEKAKTIEEMHEVLVVGSVLLAHGVYLSKQAKGFYQIEQCKNFISRNIFKKIYLKDIAEYVGLNPQYLSGLFAEKEGITLSDYIQREKIEVSCNLLKHSQKSVAEIAQYMGIQSQSNFAENFKKWKGQTPTEYRRENWSQVF